MTLYVQIKTTKSLGKDTLKPDALFKISRLTDIFWTFEWHFHIWIVTHSPWKNLRQVKTNFEKSCDIHRNVKITNVWCQKNGIMFSFGFKSWFQVWVISAPYFVKSVPYMTVFFGVDRVKHDWPEIWFSFVTVMSGIFITLY